MPILDSCVKATGNKDLNNPNKSVNQLLPSASISFYKGVTIHPFYQTIASLKILDGERREEKVASEAFCQGGFSKARSVFGCAFLLRPIGIRDRINATNQDG